MSFAKLEQVLELAVQLEPNEQALLVAKLLAHQSGRVTRALLLEEHQQLLAQGAFNNHVESLYGKYAQTDSGLSFEDIEAAIHENSWEDELDEFYKPD
jgi:hypothetical protein